MIEGEPGSNVQGGVPVVQKRLMSIRGPIKRFPTWTGVPTERTPLVSSAPLFEEADEEIAEHVSLGQQYWTETVILLKYTLPVVA